MYLNRDCCAYFVNEIRGFTPQEYLYGLFDLLFRNVYALSLPLMLELSKDIQDSSALVWLINSGIVCPRFCNVFFNMYANLFWFVGLLESMQIGTPMCMHACGTKKRMEFHRFWKFNRMIERETVKRYWKIICVLRDILLYFTFSLNGWTSYNCIMFLFNNCLELCSPNWCWLDSVGYNFFLFSSQNCLLSYVTIL